ncbi:MAG: hypothetical protein IJY16_04100 [Clostridia bacterium]|nr:hypothetical protein [Clostridia bacterium]
MKRFLSLLLCLLLCLCVIPLSGCLSPEEKEQSEALCREFMDYVILNHKKSAYNMLKDVGTAEEFASLWAALREVFGNSKSYELERTGWERGTDDELLLLMVNYEITTDDGKVAQLTVVTAESMEGFAGLHFQDSTAFAQSTSFVPVVNVLLVLFSLASFGFAIWMFVDCLRRRMKLKVLFAFVTLLHTGISLTFGNAWGFYVNFSFVFALSRMVADRAAFTLTVTAFLPIGAILYLCLRKSLTLPPASEPTASPYPPNAAPSPQNFVRIEQQPPVNDPAQPAAPAANIPPNGAENSTIEPNEPNP